MSDPGVNLLDLLDQLRDLAPAEQEQRLAALPAATRDQLRPWLQVAQRKADPFDAVANALAGADKELLEKLRTNLSRLRNDAPKTALDPASHTTIPSPPGGILPQQLAGGATSATSARTTADGRLAFQAGDVLLKQFRIVCQLGRGGMGEVFRAIDEHAGEQVALKFLPADRMADREALDLLKSEVRVAHLVRSPYVCAIHGLHLDNDAAPGRPGLPPFIAMQFIEGEDLHTLLKRVERLSGPKVVRIAHELTRGMAAIHAAGILHRDLKPSNVMLDVQGTVQILDFGIAAIANPGPHDATNIAGTPAYMAPEARDTPATVASDIYALGLLLFELTTGQMASAAIAARVQPMQILEPYKGQVARELIDAIDRCLRFNPAERFQSMEELLRALPAPEPVKGRRESISTIAKSDAVAPFAPWAIVAVIAFIVVAGIGVFLIGPRPGSAAAAHLPRDPAELAGGARRFAAFFGAQDDSYSAHGYAMSTAGAVSAQNPPGTKSNGLYFWYRSAAKPLEASSAVRGLSVSDPPSGPGMTTLTYDPDEVLLEAWRQPEVDAKAGDGNETSLPTDLTDALKRRTVGGVNFPMKPVGPKDLPAGWVAPISFPAGTEFWLEPAGPKPPKNNRPLLVAMFGSHLVYIGRPPQPSESATAPAVSRDSAPASFAWLDRYMSGPTQWLRQHTTQDLAFWWMYAMPVLGLGLALRNIRMRRCDTRHALRVAGVVFSLSLLGWVLLTLPGVTGKTMNERWNTGIGIALLVGAQAWISYAAVDPYARLTWKRCLIGYARFTAGWPSAITRDAIVGRSILSGVVFGLSLALLLKVLDRFSPATVSSNRDQLAAALLGDGLRTAGLMFRAASSAIVFALLQFVTLVLLHWLTRRRIVAIALFCLVTPLLWSIYRNDFGFPGYLIYPLIGVLTAIALIHEGVLTMAVGLFFSSVLTTVPFTFDAGAPHIGISVVVLGLLVLVVLTGLLAVIPRGITTRWWPSDPIRFGTTDPTQHESA